MLSRAGRALLKALRTLEEFWLARLGILQKMFRIFCARYLLSMLTVYEIRTKQNHLNLILTTPEELEHVYESTNVPPLVWSYAANNFDLFE